MEKKLNPWETHPKIWKNKSAFFSWLRSNIRKSLWSRSPIKLDFIKKNRKMIDNPKKGTRNKPRVWGAECCICKKDFVLKEIEVDHKIGNHSLREIEDIQNFIMNIVLVCEDDLQLVCKSCHTIKTHSEKYNISFEDATLEKKLIAYIKLKPIKQTEILDKFNLPSNNASIRKQNFKKIINELPNI